MLKDVILGALRQILPQDQPLQALEIASGRSISITIFDRLRLRVFFSQAPAPAPIKKKVLEPLQFFKNNIPFSLSERFHLFKVFVF